ncbi:hypothetical protein BSLG_007640 [Batrachochytrium salamandrivorans]|nr:hypothetical protein BSLG_007640 [Batrachochytrium salamandrivorans]
MTADYNQDSTAGDAATITGATDLLQTAEECAAWPQTAYDKYWLGILQDKTVFKQPSTALDAARNGLRFFRQLQTPDGHFAGEYGGPMFLIPGLVIAMYISGASYPPGYVEELIRYLKTTANKDDGGWGIHIEGVSTCFGTSLNYVALRLLGSPANDPVCVKARDTLWKLGGACGVPAWGKFWLSVLNVYDWSGNSPIPPELCLLAYGIFIRYSLSGKVDDLILSLREELYTCDYSAINWPQQCNNVAAVDIYSPHSSFLDIFTGLAGIYESLPNGILRSRALDEVLLQIRMEDKNTNFLDLGPVNKAINLLVSFVVDGPTSDNFKRHVERVPDFMWMSDRGMMMNGTNGSQLWDTAFAVQSILESNLGQEPEFHDMISRAYAFVDDMQIKRNAENHERCYRHISKGAWPFSTQEQSYTVSDCTAEGLKGVLMVHNKLKYVAFLLTVDCYASCYELQRGSELLEILNPSEVFGKIMVEYSYTECTTSVLLGLSSFRKTYPYHRAKEIDETVDRAVNFIRKLQLPNGLWFGSWGVCFTYATFFAVESLSSVGETYKSSDSLRSACDGLVEKQMWDGGWGESYRTCETGLIMSRQLPNGEWPQEAIEGVFNKNCMISYPNYKFVFPIWALGRYSRYYETTSES